MVTKVFLGQRVAIIIQGQIQGMGQASYASLGDLYYSDHETFKKRLMEVTKIMASAGAATLVPFCVLNRPFIALWVGEGYQMEDNALTYLSSANAFLYALFGFWSFIFTVLGKPAEITRMIWKQALVNVVASIAFTLLIGGVGPIAGTLASFLLVPLWTYPRLLKEHFGLPARALFATLFWPIAVAVLPLTIYHFSSWRLFPTTWPAFFASGVSLFGVYALFFFIVLFDREEKEIFLARVRRFTARFL
jgi:O-antigen/teichoic acid export membrane protein